jgi:hypothetical protein
MEPTRIPYTHPTHRAIKNIHHTYQETLPKNQRKNQPPSFPALSTEVAPEQQAVTIGS